jgi:hypothetical protein
MGQVCKMDLKLAVTAIKIRGIEGAENDPQTFAARQVQGSVFQLLNAYSPPAPVGNMR